MPLCDCRGRKRKMRRTHHKLLMCWFWRKWIIQVHGFLEACHFSSCVYKNKVKMLKECVYMMSFSTPHTIWPLNWMICKKYYSFWRLWFQTFQHYNWESMQKLWEFRVKFSFSLNDHKRPPNSHNDTKQLDDDFFSKERGCD